jgi:hypothetical protein
MVDTPVTDWVTIEQVADYLGADAPASDDTEGQARLARCITSASDCLYGLSGRKFPGELEATVHPTARIRMEYMAGAVPMWGSWPNNTWGVCVDPTHNSCQGSPRIGLGRAPINSVSEVILAGEVLDPINYAVEDQRWLVRTDCCSWPTCGCEGCGDNAFTVTFKFGDIPPQMGMDAATVLAAEMYRAMTPNTSGCRLPTRLTSITRQGVTMAIIDPMDFFAKGLTGNYQIDLFINTYNPARQIRKPIVFSPDVTSTGRRRTWPTPQG